MTINQFMIATKDSFEPHSSEQLPASQRIYVASELHPDVRVPMREIMVGDTKSYTGAVEKNAPVRVYDCSGPWGDPAFTGKSEEGLPALRRDWILKRGDVEEHAGREVKPMDNGYLSGKHAEFASKAEKKPACGISRAAWSAPASVAREQRPSGHAALVCETGHYHAGDGIHRHP